MSKQYAALSPEDIKALQEKVNAESPELAKLNQEIRQLKIARDAMEGKLEYEERDGKIIARKRSV